MYSIDCNFISNSCKPCRSVTRTGVASGMVRTQNTSNLSLRSQLASSTSLHSILSLLVVDTSSATVLSSFFCRSNPTKHHTETTAIVRTISKTKLLILGIVENARTSTAICEKFHCKCRGISFYLNQILSTQETMSNIIFFTKSLSVFLSLSKTCQLQFIL